MHGAEGRQKHIDWLLKFNLRIYLVLICIQFTHLHQYLDAILLRHLEVEQHEVNWTDHISLVRDLDFLFQNTLYLIYYNLSINAIGAFTLQSHISKLGFENFQVDQLIVCGNYP